ncbi:MAG: HEAT repeat protein [Candidatus Paceibacteria bacterium]|jgi:HEAT repeat protein
MQMQTTIALCLARSLAAASVILLLGFATGCASTENDHSIASTDDETYRPMGPASRRDDSIGKYLADLSTSISAWNSKTIAASNDSDRRKQALLEINIRERARNRFGEILLQLETGPEHNRVIAAAAIGFAGQEEALSPLLAALDDTSDKVVGNALLGLGTLGSKETPLHKVGDLLRYSPNSRTRWSAADCALSLVAAGADPDGIKEAARSGLTDAEEPIVRTQSALILAFIGDTDSIEALGDLVFDEVPLVSSSAAQALAFLGRKHPEAAGPAARALYTALAEGKRDLQLRVHPSLVRLSRRDYDLDLKLWDEWVRRLP